MIIWTFIEVRWLVRSLCRLISDLLLWKVLESSKVYICIDVLCRLISAQNHLFLKVNLADINLKMINSRSSASSSEGRSSVPMGAHRHEVIALQPIPHNPCRDALLAPAGPRSPSEDRSFCVVDRIGHAIVSAVYLITEQTRTCLLCNPPRL